MKARLFFLLFVPLLFSFKGSQSLEDISKALGRGDVVTITTYLDAEVELSVMGEDDFYSGAEASAVLKEFFGKYPASKFSQIHNGVSPTTKAEYCIGNLDAGGTTFRVVIYLSAVEGRLKIKKLSIDEE